MKTKLIYPLCLFLVSNINIIAKPLDHQDSNKEEICLIPPQLNWQKLFFPFSKSRPTPQHVEGCCHYRPTPCCYNRTNLLFKIRTGFFWANEALFRKIYGHHIINYDMELGSHRNRCSDRWINFGVLSKKGSVKYCGPTDLLLLSLSLGLANSFQISNSIDLYSGVGLRATRAKVVNHFCCLDKEINFSVGAVFKQGLNIFFTDDLLLNLFFDYSYQPAFAKHHIDIGGWNTGIGLGATF